jgi:PPK2 family polyphosphate:nucleotide phosphotransferase
MRDHDDPVLAALMVPPGEAAQLAARPTRDPAGLEADKDAATTLLLPALREEVERLQQRLYAEDARSVLLVLQGTDTSGKDGTIRHVLGGVTPSGTRVAAFKAPGSTELAHDYLWRIHAACPERGQIGVFNRSHYEDVMAVRVRALVDEDRWRRRYRHIREFERMLVDEGTVLVKCFLHLSRDEQRERLQARLDDPEKRWKFRLGDLDDRARWPAFQAAYEDALTETSTAEAPWHVIPADRKWQRNLLVAQVLVAALQAMDPQIPAAAEETEGVVIPA